MNNKELHSKNYLILQELIPETLIIFNAELEVISTNNKLSKLFPQLANPKKGDQLTQLFSAPEYLPLLQLFRQAPREKEIYSEVQISSNQEGATVIDFHCALCSEGFLCLIRDNSECSQMKEVLGKKILKYQCFIEMLPAMVCETNQEGLLTFASNLALERFGYTHADIKKGLHLFSLLSDADIPRAQKNFAKILQGQKLPPREYRLKTKTGEQFPAIIQVESIVDGDRVTGFRGKLEDLTEIKKIEHELKEAKEHAEHLNKTKSDFLANFSHEVKTPINAIIGLSNSLIKRISDPTQLSQLKTIRKSGNILLSLINDILDLSKIEAGKLELYNEPVDIHELLMDISETFSYSIEEKGLIYYSNIDANVPKYLLLDGIKLRQILFNLVGNAVKFTEKGHIAVHLGATQKNGSYNLTLSVEDSGYGIPKAQQRLIFEAFEQGEKLRKTEGGTGLGLAITKRIVSMMKGNIRIKSQLFKGSTFIINLPNIKDVEIATGDRLKQDGGSANYFPDLHALIVDDIYTNIQTLEAYLLNYNCKIQSVQKVSDAFLALEKTDLPNLIFMDVFMPDISGIEACRHIKNSEHLKHIPVIAYSANIHHLKAKDKDLFDGFLPKPIKEATLVEILSQYSTRKWGQHLELPDSLIDLEESLQMELRNQLYKQWTLINEYFINQDIEKFAQELRQIADTHSSQLLIHYSDNLQAQINAFNISEVELELNKLSEIFGKE